MGYLHVARTKRGPSPKGKRKGNDAQRQKKLQKNISFDLIRTITIQEQILGWNLGVRGADNKGGNMARRRIKGEGSATCQKR